MVVQSPKCVEESSISNGELSVKNEPEFQKRVSARIKDKQRAEKELLVRRRVELLDDQEDVAAAVGGGSSEKRKRNYSKKRCTGENVHEEEEKQANGEAAKVAEGLEVGKGKPMNRNLEAESKGVVAEKSDCAKVKETIRLFNKYYLLLVQVNYFLLLLVFSSYVLF